MSMSYCLYLIGFSIFGFAFLGGLYAICDLLDLFLPMWRNRQREREEIRQLQHQARVQQMKRELGMDPFCGIQSVDLYRSKP